MGRESWLRWPACCYCYSLPVWERPNGKLAALLLANNHVFGSASVSLKLLSSIGKKQYLKVFSKSCINFVKHKAKGRPQTTAIFPYSVLLRPLQRPKFLWEEKGPKKNRMGPSWVSSPPEQGLEKKTRPSVWRRESSLHEPHLFCGREGRWSSVQGTQGREKTSSVNIVRVPQVHNPHG